MKKLLLTLVLSVFLMTSCANQPSLADDTRKIEDSVTTNSATSSPESSEVTTATEDAAAPESTVVTSGELTAEDIGKLYPDKTVLTISCSTYIHRPKMIRNANEYLSSIGKEYVIYLCPVEAESVIIGDIGRLDYNSPIEKIADKIDVILSADYLGAVEKGLLLPLDEYITDSKLSSFIPEKLWNGVRIDGAIYGIDCYSQIGSQRGYFINSELADKYGFDLEKPLIEQLDTLKVIDEKENCTPVITYNQFFTTSYYLDSIPVASGVCLDSDGRIKSILEDDGYIGFLREMFTLNQKGLLKDAQNAIMGDFFAFEASTRLPPENFVALDYAKEYDYLSGEPDFARVYPAFLGSPRLIRSRTAAGISAKSSHAGYAFDFLETVFTDSTLNNIMCYGDYPDKLSEDGRISEMYETAISQFYNGLITLPSFKESVNKKENFIRTVEALEVDPNIGFTFRIGDLVNEQDKVNAKVYEMCNMLLKDEVASFEEYISAFKAALSEASLDKLIDSAAEQYDEWRGEQ